MINQSLIVGIPPEKLKKARVLPLFIKATKHLLKNTAQYLSWYRYPKYLKKSLYNCQNIFTIAACFMKTNTVFEKITRSRIGNY